MTRTEHSAGPAWFYGHGTGQKPQPDLFCACFSLKVFSFENVFGRHAGVPCFMHVLFVFRLCRLLLIRTSGRLWRQRQPFKQTEPRR